MYLNMQFLIFALLLLSSNSIPTNLSDSQTSEPSTALQLAFCDSTNYVNGKWLKYKKQRAESIPCCGWDVQAYSKKYNDNYRSKMCTSPYYPKFDTDLSNFDRIPAFSGGHSCTCMNKWLEKRNNIDDIGVMPSEEYKWVPNDCKLPEWSEIDFCSILNNRSVAMIGDSTMQIAFASLRNMMYYGQNASLECLSLVKYYRHNTVISISEDQDHINNISSVLLKHQPHILVVSAGAHLSSLENFKVVAAEIVSALHSHNRHISSNTNIGPLQSHHPTELIYVTAQPGISNCHKYDAPVDEILPSSTFNYGDIYLMNEYAKLFFASHNITLLDLRPLSLRPDAKPKFYQPGHHDCLHFCLPGPLEIFSQILANLLSLPVSQKKTAISAPSPIAFS